MYSFLINLKVVSIDFLFIEEIFEVSVNSLFCFKILEDKFINNGSFVKQYPPTPNPGLIILLCVFLNLIASIAKFKLSLFLIENLVHSSIKAILSARYEFSMIFVISHSIIVFILISGNFLVLIILSRNFSHNILDFSFMPE